MKVFSLFACVVAIAVCLSYIPADAGVYRAKSKASCSGVAKSKVYSRGRAASCSGVSRSVVRSKRSCAG